MNVAAAQCCAVKLTAAHWAHSTWGHPLKAHHMGTTPSHPHQAIPISNFAFVILMTINHLLPEPALNQASARCREQSPQLRRTGTGCQCNFQDQNQDLFTTPAGRSALLPPSFFSSDLISHSSLALHDICASYCTGCQCFCQHGPAPRAGHCVAMLLYPGKPTPPGGCEPWASLPWVGTGLARHLQEVHDAALAAGHDGIRTAVAARKHAARQPRVRHEQALHNACTDAARAASHTTWARHAPQQVSEILNNASDACRLEDLKALPAGLHVQLRVA